MDGRGGGARFACRRSGTGTGVPLILVQHSMGNLDTYDPAVTDDVVPLYTAEYERQDTRSRPRRTI
ncbi:hypothetical protein Psi02_74860 [Planotetraspora silvatica]|uniref:Uncharacterized protein n=2 Tax=Planotetraspora silvatica TaxID=234614 RepID=A0A8J3UTJ4_9ACTN|nr:hypothetical protein Psi02_74860 [Planotetraspora silvatica]